MVLISRGSEHRPVRVAIDRAAAGSAPEVAYVIRMLLTTAGYPWLIEWADSVTGPVDIAYGRQAWPGAAIRVPAVPWTFREAPGFEPTGSIVHEGIPLLLFEGEPVARVVGHTGDLEFPVDLLFNCYWWLTGAREPHYPRDRRDNLNPASSVIVRDGLLRRPCVSLAAALLRQRFARMGRPARIASWRSGGAEAAFTFTHDVDYPEIIKWIEAPRVLLGAGGVRSAIDIINGKSHYWTFREWIELEREFGTRPTFYFMARRGSLAAYAMGTPDDFYDIGTRRFAALFSELREHGCEIGLHASYHAHRSSDQLRRERIRVESLAQVTGVGNRHHYWHLDPTDPNETLRRHEEAGLAYDSSLEFEYYPGFRRGVCQPFLVYHAGLRRALHLPQLPPAWMDDHFDRRLARNGITDPDSVARELLGAVRASGGVAVVDYHSRGMNTAVYPRYGAWLRTFAFANLDRSIKCMTPSEVLAAWLEHEEGLSADSSDRLGADSPGVSLTAREETAVRQVSPADATAIARIYMEAFPSLRLSRLGAEFATRYISRLLSAPQAIGVVAESLSGECLGFAIGYSGLSADVQRWLFRRPVEMAWAATAAVARRPALLVDILRGAAAQGAPTLDANGAFLVSIAVSRESHGQGFGRALLTAFVAVASRAGAGTVWLEVAPDREAAMKLYDSFGFRHAGAARQPGSQPSSFMKLDLPVRGTGRGDS